MARGDADKYARRAKVVGPTYRDGGAPCGVEIRHGTVNGSHVVYAEATAARHALRRAASTGAMCRLLLSTARRVLPPRRPL